MKLQRVGGLEQQVDAAHYSRLALSATDGVQRLRQGEKTARTGRVHRVTGPVEVERVRDPIGEHCSAASGEPVTVDALLHSAPVVVGLALERAHVHSSFRSTDVVRIDACESFETVIRNKTFTTSSVYKTIYAVGLGAIYRILSMFYCVCTAVKND